jgi:hypothetical protein
MEKRMNKCSKAIAEGSQIHTIASISLKDNVKTIALSSNSSTSITT